jgi:hypothetical protein
MDKRPNWIISRLLEGGEREAFRTQEVYASQVGYGLVRNGRATEAAEALQA